jgi:hypothetical protein
VSDDIIIKEYKGVSGMKADMGSQSFRREWPQCHFVHSKHFVMDSFNEKTSLRSGMNIGES